MSVTPESVKQMLSSENLGDRLRAVNQIRELEPAIAFELVQQPSMTAMLASAVSQMDTLGGQDLSTALTVLRDRLFNGNQTYKRQRRTAWAL